MVGELEEEVVVVVHECGEECGDGGSVVVGVADGVAYGVDDVSCGVEVVLAGGNLEVAHLTVERRWHLPLREGHGELVEEDDAVDFEVAGDVLWHDDGAWREVCQRAGPDVPFLQVEADIGFASGDDAEAVVVDDEGWSLPHE